MKKSPIQITAQCKEEEINSEQIKIAFYDALIKLARQNRWRLPARNQVVNKNKQASFEITQGSGKDQRSCEVKFTEFGAEFSGSSTDPQSIQIIKDAVDAYTRANRNKVEMELSLVVENKDELKKVLAVIKAKNFKEIFLSNDLNAPLKDEEIGAIEEEIFQKQKRENKESPNKERKKPHTQKPANKSKQPSVPIPEDEDVDDADEDVEAQVHALEKRVGLKDNKGFFAAFPKFAEKIRPEKKDKLWRIERDALNEMLDGAKNRKPIRDAAKEKAANYVKKHNLSSDPMLMNFNRKKPTASNMRPATNKAAPIATKRSERSKNKAK